MPSETKPNYLVLCQCNKGMKFGVRIEIDEPGLTVGTCDVWSCYNCDNLISVQFPEEA